jgi:hypothetical protein
VIRSGEQSADQLRSLAETLLLSGFQLLVGEFRFKVLEHPRQRHGEREKGLLQVGGGHFSITLASSILIRTALCPMLVASTLGSFCILA